MVNSTYTFRPFCVIYKLYAVEESILCYNLVVLVICDGHVFWKKVNAIDGTGFNTMNPRDRRKNVVCIYSYTCTLYAHMHVHARTYIYMPALKEAGLLSEQRGAILSLLRRECDCFCTFKGYSRSIKSLPSRSPILDVHLCWCHFRIGNFSRSIWAIKKNIHPSCVRWLNAS